LSEIATVKTDIRIGNVDPSCTLTGEVVSELAIVQISIVSVVNIYSKNPLSGIKIRVEVPSLTTLLLSSMGFWGFGVLGDRKSVV